MSLRKMREQLVALLQQEDFHAALQGLTALPARPAVNPLLGLLHHRDQLVRWHAVSALGVVTAGLAEQDLEAARVVMRRLMWNLNDESGGIGWGSPESLGEIMARHSLLAREYAAILISYLNPQGNYLELEGLQQGLLWGFGRLAHARPLAAAEGRCFVKPFFSSQLAALRGLAVWASAALMHPGLEELIRPLCDDNAVFTFYSDLRLRAVTVAELARKALGALGR